MLTSALSSRVVGEDRNSLESAFFIYFPFQMNDAFFSLRSMIGEPREPNLSTLKYKDELTQMSYAEGLLQIEVRPPTKSQSGAACPDVTTAMKDNAHLWVVREEDAVHAPEHCEFGRSLTIGKVKHTNLTGGASAFAGGEMIWLGEREILVNGCSGRYGPRSAAEMQAAAEAFTNAGYRVWSTGYDEGTGSCFRFGASIPVEVQ